MKAYLIARVSTEDQKDALPAQRYRLLDYAQGRFTHHRLVELRESAYKGAREGLRKTLSALVEETPPVAVVFDKIDRYTRDSTAEEARTIQLLCRSGSIELHFVSDSLVLSRDSSANDWFRLGMGAVTAQYYSDAISDNVRRRQQQMLRDGLWLSKAPFGYRNITTPDNKKWIEPHPIEAKVVKKMYELYGTGVFSMHAVKEKIREDFGIVMVKSKVEAILRNPFYAGEMIVNGNRYPHHYKRLVTPAAHKDIQEIRQGIRTKARKTGMLPYTYRGLVSCSDCDCTITFERQKKQYVYGHCTQSKGKHSAAYIREEVFDQSIQQALKSIRISDEDLEFVLSELKKIVDAEKSKSVSDQVETAKEIKKIERRLERLFDAYMDGDIDAEIYKAKSNEYKEKIQKIKNPKEIFELSVFERYKELSHLLSLANRAKSLFKKGTVEEKRVIVKSVLSNWTVEGKELRWKLKKPFEMMAFCSESSSWQG